MPTVSYCRGPTTLGLTTEPPGAPTGSPRPTSPPPRKGEGYDSGELSWGPRRGMRPHELGPAHGGIWENWGARSPPNGAWCSWGCRGQWLCPCSLTLACCLSVHFAQGCQMTGRSHTVTLISYKSRGAEWGALRLGGALGLPAAEAPAGHLRRRTKVGPAPCPYPGPLSSGAGRAWG